MFILKIRQEIWRCSTTSLWRNHTRCTKASERHLDKKEKCEGWWESMACRRSALRPISILGRCRGVWEVDKKKRWGEWEEHDPRHLPWLTGNEKGSDRRRQCSKLPCFGHPSHLVQDYLTTLYNRLYGTKVFSQFARKPAKIKTSYFVHRHCITFSSWCSSGFQIGLIVFDIYTKYWIRL